MNKTKLLNAEKKFFEKHPQGFAEPMFQEIMKKHNVAKMTTLCQEYFALEQFQKPLTIIDNMIKIISRASMVSLFEKPKFRDFVKELKRGEKIILSKSLENVLHGDTAEGFSTMVDILKQGKLAKWSLMTIIPFYYSPREEVFVKPTTTKHIIKYLEVPTLIYRPTPSWDFYRRFRSLINQIKQDVNPSLSISNAAFTGFLMMSGDEDEME